jgi:hypothetical protein
MRLSPRIPIIVTVASLPHITGIRHESPAHERRRRNGLLANV